MYRVELQNFEGPLDLLLFFIKRDEIDIKDIPIARVTDQFVEYLNLMEELDLEIASEFILMAGTLMSIKAKILLPRPEAEDDELTEDDPRYELVKSLLEYKRYKETAEDFRDYEKAAAKEYYRGYHKTDEVARPIDGDALRDVSIIHLMAAMQDVLLRKASEPDFHHIEKSHTSIEEQSALILQRLRKDGKTSFIKLCMEVNDRMTIVITFLSVLEMVKENQIELFITDQNHFEFFIDIPRIDSKELLENA